MYEGVQTELKALLSVSNAGILFADTFLQKICEHFGECLPASGPKNPIFYSRKLIIGSSLIQNCSDLLPSDLKKHTYYCINKRKALQISSDV